MIKLRKSVTPHARLGSTLVLTNLTEEQTDLVKEALTYKNPAYENAMRFSGYRSVSIPKEIKYYVERGNKLYVPVGFDFTKLGITSVCDTRNRVTLKVPRFVLTLRDDQREAAEAYLRANKGYGKQCGLIQMPTGKGKSITGLYLASALKQRTLVIVHKTDLVRGWKKDIELSFNNKVDVGIFGSGKRKLGEFITIATVQTLNKLSDEEFSSLQNYFGFVIIDECHHAPASSYDIVNDFNARYKLGLTATPERKDGLKNLMHDFLGDFCFRCVVTEDDTDVLPVNVIVRKPNTFFDPVCQAKTHQNGAKTWLMSNLLAGEDYELNDDEKRFSELSYKQRPKLQFTEVEDIVVKDKYFVSLVVHDMVQAINSGKSCIAFFNQKAHCSMYYHRLIRAGIPESLVQIYNGDCSKKELETCLQRAESKEALMTLTTFSKSTEGTNVKAWEVEFLVGSTNDGKNAEQAVGRVRRVAPNKTREATVYDYYLQKVPMLAKHFFTREQRYQKLGFKVGRLAQKHTKTQSRVHKKS